MKTYTWACPLCPLWIEDAVTVEHLERALLLHVEAEHPSYLKIAHHSLTQGHRPVSLFDTVETDEGATTTCSVCGAGVLIEPADPEAPELQSFRNEHIDRHADVLKEERAS